MKMVRVPPRLFEEIYLPSDEGPLRIEVAADDEIDCGVMDSDSYYRFAEADSDEGIKKEQWFPEVRSKSFVFKPNRRNHYFLVLSNAYSDRKVSVAYAVSPGEE